MGGSRTAGGGGVESKPKWPDGTQGRPSQSDLDVGGAPSSSPPLSPSSWVRPAVSWKQCRCPSGRRWCASAPGPAGAQAHEDRAPRSAPPPHARPGSRVRCLPRMSSEALAAHLHQLKPDGPGVVGRAVVEFQARGPIALQGAQQVESLQVLQGDGAVQFLGAVETAELGPSQGRGHRGWWESGARCSGQHQGGSLAHLGAGVHEDEVLAVESQEAGSGQGQLTDPQHHIDGVAKEGQLAHSLWEGRGRERSSGHCGPGTCPTASRLDERGRAGREAALHLHPFPSRSPALALTTPRAPDPPMKLICASWELHACIHFNSCSIRFFMVDVLTNRCSGFGK